MNKIFISIILFTSFQLFSQNNIEVGNSTVDYMKIINIYNSNDETIIVIRAEPTIDISGTLHGPNSDSPFILSDQKGMRYALKKQSGWNGDGYDGFGTVAMIASSSKEFKLHFNNIQFERHLFFNRIKL